MFEAGQKVVFVGGHRYNSGVSEVEITKVGRSWVYASNGHRFDLETMRADGKGYNSPGTFYKSREEYDTLQRRNAVWDSLRDLINKEYCAPDRISLAALEQAAILLGAVLGQSRDDAKEG